MKPIGQNCAEPSGRDGLYFVRRQPTFQTTGPAPGVPSLVFPPALHFLVLCQHFETLLMQSCLLFKLFVMSPFSYLKMWQNAYKVKFIILI